jgi:hypothetical protein
MSSPVRFLQETLKVVVINNIQKDEKEILNICCLCDEHRSL